MCGRKRKRHFLFFGSMALSQAPGSAALAAQGRKRGPSVLERLRAEEDAAQEAAAASARAFKRHKTMAASEMSKEKNILKQHKGNTQKRLPGVRGPPGGRYLKVT